MKADTIRFIESAGRNGFSQIELDIDRLEAAIKKDDLSKIRAVIKDSNIEVVSLNAIDNYPIMSEDEMAGSLKRSQAVLDLCNSIGSGILVVNPANFKAGQDEKLVEKRFDFFMDRLGELSEKNGIKLGYEYVSYNDKVVNTLKKTIAGLKRWRSGTDLVLDVFHMFRSGETIEDLPSDLTSKLIAFHVNDAPGISIETVVDTDRVFPLEGVMGVQKYIEELKRKNYAGPVSVELFNQKYWDMDVDTVVKKSKESVDRLLAILIL
jgi:2-keto-myo-inositol isomerase